MEEKRRKLLEVMKELGAEVVDYDGEAYGIRYPVEKANMVLGLVYGDPGFGVSGEKLIDYIEAGETYEHWVKRYIEFFKKLYDLFMDGELLTEPEQKGAVDFLDFLLTLLYRIEEFDPAAKEWTQEAKEERPHRFIIGLSRYNKILDELYIKKSNDLAMPVLKSFNVSVEYDDGDAVLRLKANNAVDILGTMERIVNLHDYAMENEEMYQLLTK